MIATLGTMAIFRGFAFLTSGGSSVSIGAKSPNHQRVQAHPRFLREGELLPLGLACGRQFLQAD